MKSFPILVVKTIDVDREIEGWDYRVYVSTDGQPAVPLGDYFLMTNATEELLSQVFTDDHSDPDTNYGLPGTLIFSDTPGRDGHGITGKLSGNFNEFLNYDFQPDLDACALLCMSGLVALGVVTVDKKGNWAKPYPEYLHFIYDIKDVKAVTIA